MCAVIHATEEKKASQNLMEVIKKRKVLWIMIVFNIKFALFYNELIHEEFVVIVFLLFSRSVLN